MTAHTLEEGHYVIGPKIDIPLQYPGVARWHRDSARRWGEKDRGSSGAGRQVGLVGYTQFWASVCIGTRFANL